MANRYPPSDRKSDKNTRRIELQAKIQARVKNGVFGASLQNGGSEGLDSLPGYADREIHFAVDPELEREMAARTLSENNITAQSRKNKPPAQMPNQQIKMKENLPATPKGNSKAASKTHSKAVANVKANVKRKSNGKSPSKTNAKSRKAGAQFDDPIEDSGVWTDKGDPTFASPEDNLPGPV